FRVTRLYRLIKHSYITRINKFLNMFTFSNYFNYIKPKISLILYPIVIFKLDIIKNYEILIKHIVKSYLNYINTVNHLILFIYRTRFNLI
ncbi:hypothetical protein P170DRAFT_356033, partial [Aspergillus steynii IBT 23096]